jgi:Flp pilus assembly protein CpaB
MRAVHPSSKRRSWPLVVGVLAALVGGGAGTVGTLWSMGELDLSFFKKKETIPPGAIGIPVSARRIAAFTKVTRDDLIDPQTKAIKAMYLMPEQVPSEALLKLSEIIGQVLDHDKPPGYAFTDADFLPKGTRPGLSAGVPPGKRAITVEASKLGGAQAVRTGDHVDILATQPVDVSKNPRGLFGGAGANPMLSPAVAAKLQKQAIVKVLVQDGVAVTPVTTRMVPITSSSLTRGATTRTKPVQEIVLAVDPSEVSPFSEALAIESDLTCVIRSGRPEESELEESRVTPEAPNPLAAMSWVETIRGDKREWVVAPSNVSPPRMPNAN